MCRASHHLDAFTHPHPETSTSEAGTQSSWPRGTPGWHDSLRPVRLESGRVVLAEEPPPPIGGRESNVRGKSSAQQCRELAREGDMVMATMPPPLPDEEEEENRPVDSEDDGDNDGGNHGGAGREIEQACTRTRMRQPAGTRRRGRTSTEDVPRSRSMARTRTSRTPHEHPPSAAARPGVPASERSASADTHRGSRRRPRSKTPERRPITGSAIDGSITPPRRVGASQVS